MDDDSGKQYKQKEGEGKSTWLRPSDLTTDDYGGMSVRQEIVNAAFGK